MKTLKALPALLLAAGLTFGVALNAPVFADDGAKTTQPDSGKAKGDKKDKGDKDDKKAAGAMPGSVAPTFSLTDTDGKTHTLDEHKGKIVVLEWFNPECPFVVKHHQTNKTFSTLHQEYSSKGVVFLAINSSASGKQGHGLELNKKMKEEFGIQYPILIDESGTVGRAYGAKTTPHVFIIDAQGKVAYNGAIDNDRSRSKPGDKNYAKIALDELLASKAVSTPKTDPYGCSVKYAN
jgi:peroxiredoxin